MGQGMNAMDKAIARVRAARPGRAMLGTANFLIYVMRRFQADRMTQAAGALTYSTLLAIVPLLVIAFAVISGFPAFDAVRGQMEQLFVDALVPEVGQDVQNYVGEFTANAGNLTAVGIVALTLTAILLLSTIEGTLNRIWRVERPRPLFVRLLIFWTVLTLGPMLFGASFTVTSDMFATLERWTGEAPALEELGESGSFLEGVLPVLFEIAFFTLLFMIVPARRVQLRHAALGGTISGLSFEVLQYFFNTFLTSGSTYQTIYGAVAVFPIFLIWVYLSWTVIIIGAMCAAAFPDWWRTRDQQGDGAVLSAPARLQVAVALLGVLWRQAQVGGTVPPERLTDLVPLDVRETLIEELRSHGYIAVAADDTLSLARDLNATTVADLARDLDLALGATAARAPADSALAGIAGATGALPRVLERLAHAEEEVLGRTLAAVLEAAPEAPAPQGGLALAGGQGG